MWAFGCGVETPKPVLGLMGWAEKTARKPNWCPRRGRRWRPEIPVSLPPEALQRQRPMDLFPDRHHVRLRSRFLGTYLHARQDGERVTLRPRCASLKQAWAVHRHLGDDGIHYVLLHSAAYGRYLATTDASRRVVQGDHHQPQAENVRWQPFRMGHEDDILIRTVDADDDYYRYLSVKRRRLRRNDRVIVDSFVNVNDMMQWVVEPIPARHGVPALPGPIRAGFSVVGLRHAFAESRTIRFVQASDDGIFAEEGWDTFQFTGRFVYHLRNELATRLGVPDLIMCVLAGYYGRPTPLAINLPSRSHTMDIVVVIGGTPASAALRHPDVDAE